VEFWKSVNVRPERGFDPENGKQLRVNWNRKFRNNLYASIPKLMGFFNQN
jgi:hypothetical protein